jgi:hypothetical protein
MGRLSFMKLAAAFERRPKRPGTTEMGAEQTCPPRIHGPAGTFAETLNGRANPHALLGQPPVIREPWPAGQVESSAFGHGLTASPAPRYRHVL